MPDALWTVDATLRARGFSFVRPLATYSGSIRVHGTPVPVEIVIDDLTFVQLPTVRLLGKDGLPDELAHLIGLDAICFADEGGLPLDLYDPGGAVLRVLLEAAKALEKSFAGGAAQEFERELAAYWRGNVLDCAIDRPATPNILPAEVIPRAPGEPRGLVIVPPGAWPRRAASADRQKAVLLNFPENLRHAPEFRARTVADVLAYIDVQPIKPPGWRQVVVEAAANDDYCFLAAPNAIIGWLPRLPKRLQVLQGRTHGFRPGAVRRLIERQMNTIELDRLTARDISLPTCVARNLGGAPSLAGKKIVQIGGGTIGGLLARMLVQAGAGCGAPFTLYDSEALAPGNLGRHLLGFDDVGTNKAEGLAKALRTFHPDVHVVARPVDAIREWDEIEQADLLVDATGDESVAALLNDLYLLSERTGSELALLHAWVFGNGIAGQAFLNLKDGLACYRCLRVGFGGPWRYNPAKDSAAETSRIAGRCGEGSYIPFAVDASSAAAGLAFRQALDWVGGKPGKRLRTTVVDLLHGREKMEWASPKPLADCPACQRS